MDWVLIIFGTQVIKKKRSVRPVFLDYLSVSYDYAFIVLKLRDTFSLYNFDVRRHRIALLASLQKMNCKFNAGVFSQAIESLVAFVFSQSKCSM